MLLNTLEVTDVGAVGCGSVDPLVRDLKSDGERLISMAGGAEDWTCCSRRRGGCWVNPRSFGYIGRIFVAIHLFCLPFVASFDTMIQTTHRISNRCTLGSIESYDRLEIMLGGVKIRNVLL